MILDLERIMECTGVDYLMRMRLANCIETLPPGYLLQGKGCNESKTYLVVHRSQQDEIR
jgi:hypothetical protein